MSKINKYENNFNVRKWDTKHFGVKVATFSPQEPNDISEVLPKARHNKVKLLIARVDTLNTETIHHLEYLYFKLMETQVTYKWTYDKSIPYTTNSIRKLKKTDVDILKDISKESFKGYGGHFHADPKIEDDKATEVYEKWIVNSCYGNKLADDVYVADNGKITGFVTVKQIDDHTGEGMLACVLPESRKQGIYRDLIITDMKWCKKRGLDMIMTTRVNNYAVQKVWQRLGFEIQNSTHTFHKWL